MKKKKIVRRQLQGVIKQSAQVKVQHQPEEGFSFNLEILERHL